MSAAKRAEAEAAYRAARKAHKVALGEHADAYARRAATSCESPEFGAAHSRVMLAQLRLENAAREVRKAGERVLRFVARGAK